MSPREKSDPGLKALLMVVGATVLWGATYAIAARVFHRPEANSVVRGGALGLAVLGFASWQLVTAKLIRLHDEFTRRSHLVALAISFAVIGLFVFTADLLRHAGFISNISLTTIWFVMLGVWLVTILATEWYYRR